MPSRFPFMFCWICFKLFVLIFSATADGGIVDEDGLGGLLHVTSARVGGATLGGSQKDCDAVSFGDLRPKAEMGFRDIKLTLRKSPAKLVDTFAYGSDFELEELLLRFYEMGDEIDEFHIVEGDRDFTGAKKPFFFGNVLRTGKFDKWKKKIWHHKIPIPKGMHGYTLQRLQRDMMEEEMGLSQYDPDDVLLAGDLDEIVSRKALRALKYCQPVPDGEEQVIEWNTHIRMSSYRYSLKWMKGNFYLPTTVSFFHEVNRYINATNANKEALMPLATHSFVKLKSVYSRPKEIRVDDGCAGWHVTFVLNGTAGIAHKLFIMIEDRPDWAKDFKTEAELEKFLDKDFLKNPTQYDTKLLPSKLAKKDLPEAALEHPEKFPTILRDVSW